MNNRKSEIELLRIILMFMIICLHVIGHGGIFSNVDIGSKNFYIVNIIHGLFVVSVDCFIIIFGYFQYNKTISFKKVFILYMQIIFYSILIFIFYSVLVKKILINNLIITILPITYGRWWFITNYIMLYLLSPFLNFILNKLDDKSFKNIVIIIIICLYIIPTIFIGSKINSNSYGLVNFIGLYIIGYYVASIYNNIKLKKKYMYIVLYVLLTSTSTIVNIFFSIIANKQVKIFWENYNIFVVLASLMLFLFFTRLKIKSNLINYISSSTLAVYIIHDDPMVRSVIYKFFNIELWANKEFILLKIFIFAISIFNICIIIDKFRKLIMNKFESKLFNNIRNKVIIKKIIKNKNLLFKFIN